MELNLIERRVNETRNCNRYILVNVGTGYGRRKTSFATAQVPNTSLKSIRLYTTA